jgi:hypothetical protein
MANLEPLRSKGYAEHLMQAVSERISRTIDLNFIFVCRLVMSAGKRYFAVVQRSRAFAACMEVM